jgi:hypothetical protein
MCAIIGNYCLPHQSHQDQHAAISKGSWVELALRLNLGKQMRWPLNWPRNQMREEADKEPIFDEIPRRLYPACTHIDDIRNFLKGIKRNPWRQYYREKVSRNTVYSQSL